MVLEQKKNKFSIERFESVMLAAGITWQQLNKELEYDVENMLKNRHKEPMPNVINKACTIIGLKDTDYIMMNSNNFNLKNIEPVVEKPKRGKPSKYSKEDKERIMKLLETHTYDEVSKITGITISALHSLVYKINKAKGPSSDPRKNRYSDEEKRIALELLKTHTYGEVSKITGISITTLRFHKNKEENKMNMPKEVVEAVKNTEEENKVSVVVENTDSRYNNKQNNYYYRNNNNRNQGQNPNFMKDMFEKFDRMSDDELKKSSEYINAILKVRELKNRLLE